MGGGGGTSNGVPANFKRKDFKNLQMQEGGNKRRAGRGEEREVQRRSDNQEERGLERMREEVKESVAESKDQEGEQ